MNAYELLEKLAFEFAKELKNELGLLGLETVNARNSKEASGSICHTHDFCDANEVMLHAFKVTYEREAVLSSGDSRLIDAAWTLAKANKFYITDFQADQQIKL
jgi:hypothetical protein